MKDYFYIRHIPIHSDIKSQLVEKIYKTPQLTIDQDNGKFDTDYVVSNMLTRDYASIVDPIIAEHMHNFKDTYHFSGISLASMWFQRYIDGGFHPWHVHPESHFTNIYYVHLPNKSAVTKIKDPSTNSIVDIDVNEGDILTFPAFLPHESPPAQGEKIIISFNVNII